MSSNTKIDSTLQFVSEFTVNFFVKCFFRSKQTFLTLQKFGWVYLNSLERRTIEDISNRTPLVFNGWLIATLYFASVVSSVHQLKIQIMLAMLPSNVQPKQEKVLLKTYYRYCSSFNHIRFCSKTSTQNLNVVDDKSCFLYSLPTSTSKCMFSMCFSCSIKNNFL